MATGNQFSYYFILKNQDWQNLLEYGIEGPFEPPHDNSFFDSTGFLNEFSISEKYFQALNYKIKAEASVYYKNEVVLEKEFDSENTDDSTAYIEGEYNILQDGYYKVELTGGGGGCEETVNFLCNNSYTKDTGTDEAPDPGSLMTAELKNIFKTKDSIATCLIFSRDFKWIQYKEEKIQKQNSYVHDILISEIKKGVYEITNFNIVLYDYSDIEDFDIVNGEKVPVVNENNLQNILLLNPPNTELHGTDENDKNDFTLLTKNWSWPNTEKEYANHQSIFKNRIPNYDRLYAYANLFFQDSKYDNWNEQNDKHNPFFRQICLNYIDDTKETEIYSIEYKQLLEKNAYYPSDTTLVNIMDERENVVNYNKQNTTPATPKELSFINGFGENGESIEPYPAEWKNQGEGKDELHKAYWSYNYFGLRKLNNENKIPGGNSGHFYNIVKLTKGKVYYQIGRGATYKDKELKKESGTGSYLKINNLNLEQQLCVTVEGGLGQTSKTDNNLSVAALGEKVKDLRGKADERNKESNKIIYSIGDDDLKKEKPNERNELGYSFKNDNTNLFKGYQGHASVYKGGLYKKDGELKTLETIPLGVGLGSEGRGVHRNFNKFNYMQYAEDGFLRISFLGPLSAQTFKLQYDFDTDVLLDGVTNETITNNSKYFIESISCIHSTNNEEIKLPANSPIEFYIKYKNRGVQIDSTTTPLDKGDFSYSYISYFEDKKEIRLSFKELLNKEIENANFLRETIKLKIERISDLIEKISLITINKDINIHIKLKKRNYKIKAFLTDDIDKNKSIFYENDFILVDSEKSEKNKKIFNKFLFNIISQYFLDEYFELDFFKLSEFAINLSKNLIKNNNSYKINIQHDCFFKTIYSSSVDYKYTLGENIIVPSLLDNYFKFFNAFGNLENNYFYKIYDLVYKPLLDLKNISIKNLLLKNEEKINNFSISYDNKTLEKNNLIQFIEQSTKEDMFLIFLFNNFRVKIKNFLNPGIDLISGNYNYNSFFSHTITTSLKEYKFEIEIKKFTVSIKSDYLSDLNIFLEKSQYEVFEPIILNLSLPKSTKFKLDESFAEINKSRYGIFDYLDEECNVKIFPQEILKFAPFFQKSYFKGNQIRSGLKIQNRNKEILDYLFLNRTKKEDLILYPGYFRNLSLFQLENIYDKENLELFFQNRHADVEINLNLVYLCNSVVFECEENIFSQIKLITDGFYRVLLSGGHSGNGGDGKNAPNLRLAPKADKSDRLDLEGTGAPFAQDNFKFSASYSNNTIYFKFNLFLKTKILEYTNGIEPDRDWTEQDFLSRNLIISLPLFSSNNILTLSNSFIYNFKSNTFTIKVTNEIRDSFSSRILMQNRLCGYLWYQTDNLVINVPAKEGTKGSSTPRYGGGSGGSACCVAPNTKIKIKNKEKEAQEITIFDYLYSDNKTIEQIETIIIKKKKGLGLLEYKGEKIEITSDHPIFIDGEWYAVDPENAYIEGCKSILNLDEIKWKEYIDEYIVYNFHLFGPSHSYYANNFLIHNGNQGGGTCCVAYDTDIKVIGNKTKKAKDIKIGDLVQNYNETYEEIQSIYIRRKIVFHLTYLGRKIDITEDHPIVLSDGNWYVINPEKSYIKPCRKLIQNNDTSFFTTFEIKEVYNFETDGPTHSFIGNDIICHNGKGMSFGSGGNGACCTKTYDIYIPQIYELQYYGDGGAGGRNGDSFLYSKQNGSGGGAGAIGRNFNMDDGYSTSPNIENKRWGGANSYQDIKAGNAVDIFKVGPGSLYTFVKTSQGGQDGLSAPECFVFGEKNKEIENNFLIRDAFKQSLNMTQYSFENIKYRGAFLDAIFFITTGEIIINTGFNGNNGSDGLETYELGEFPQSGSGGSAGVPSVLYFLTSQFKVFKYSTELDRKFYLKEDEEQKFSYYKRSVRNFLDFNYTQKYLKNNLGNNIFKFDNDVINNKDNEFFVNHNSLENYTINNNFKIKDQQLFSHASFFVSGGRGGDMFLIRNPAISYSKNYSLKKIIKNNLINNKKYLFGGSKGAGGGCCILSTSKILTLYGQKNANELLIGDYLVTQNNNYEKIIRISETYRNDIYKININNNILYLTPDHPIFIDGEWYAVDPENAYIEGCKQLNKQFITEYPGIKKVLNFHLSGPEHTFIAENIVVHNGDLDKFGGKGGGASCNTQTFFGSVVEFQYMQDAVFDTWEFNGSPGGLGGSGYIGGAGGNGSKGMFGSYKSGGYETDRSTPQDVSSSRYRLYTPKLVSEDDSTFGGGSGAHSCCILSTSKIKILRNNNEIYIEANDIQQTDYLVTQNNNYEKIIRISETYRNDIYKININNNILYLTPDHPIFIDGEWYAVDPENAYIEGCKQLNKQFITEKLYDYLKVLNFYSNGPEHTFIAENIVVHSGNLIEISDFKKFGSDGGNAVCNIILQYWYHHKYWYDYFDNVVNKFYKTLHRSVLYDGTSNIEQAYSNDIQDNYTFDLLYFIKNKRIFSLSNSWISSSELYQKFYKLRDKFSNLEDNLSLTYEDRNYIISKYFNDEVFEKQEKYFLGNGGGLNFYRIENDNVLTNINDSWELIAKGGERPKFSKFLISRFIENEIDKKCIVHEFFPYSDDYEYKIFTTEWEIFAKEKNNFKIKNKLYPKEGAACKILFLGEYSDLMMSDFQDTHNNHINDYKFDLQLIN